MIAAILMLALSGVQLANNRTYQSVSHGGYNETIATVSDRLYKSIDGGQIASLWLWDEEAGAYYNSFGTWIEFEEITWDGHIEWSWTIHDEDGDVYDWGICS